jgi:hypothetical protein
MYINPMIYDFFQGKYEQTNETPITTKLNCSLEGEIRGLSHPI